MGERAFGGVLAVSCERLNVVADRGGAVKGTKLAEGLYTVCMSINKLTVTHDQNGTYGGLLVDGIQKAGGQLRCRDGCEGTPGVLNQVRREAFDEPHKRLLANIVEDSRNAIEHVKDLRLLWAVMEEEHHR